VIPLRVPFLDEFVSITRLAIPIVVGLSTGALITVTDAIMLAPLGPVPLAAAGLAGAVATVLFAAIYGFLSVLSVRIGTAFGAGEGRRIAGVWRVGLMLGLATGLVAALLMALTWPLMPWLEQPAEVLETAGPYWFLISAFLVPFALLTVFKSAFEAIDRPWTGTSFGVLACILNVPLNYLLIYGGPGFAGLGLTGAGIASLLAEMVALAAAYLYWRRAASTARLRVRGQRKPEDLRSVAREGAPLGLMYIAETGAMAVATLLIGLFGTVALAANQVALSVGTLLYMVPLGVAGAVAIRVSQAAGAGRADLVRAITFAALVMATSWLGMSAALLAVKGEAIAGLISQDPAVIVVATSIFFVFALSQVMDGLQSILVGALRGLSDTVVASVVSILAYWPVALPLGWVLATRLEMGPSGIWLGFVFALAIASLLLGWRFHKVTQS
jgi:MATE family multidrug resistance protein